MIKSLKLADFTCFKEAQLDFSTGINVLIGANGTGKTHVLKTLSAVLKANKNFQGLTAQSKSRFEELIAERLIAHFKPEQLGRLSRRQAGRSASQVTLVLDTGKEMIFGFSTNSKASVKLETNGLGADIDSIYLPPREMLSLYEGFLSLYEKRELSIDETYFLLAQSLDANILRGARFENTSKLIAPLESATNAKVVKENGRFYLKDGNGKMEAHLVAEGLRKIATLMYLISNGEISKNTILFWDEPESNLNPKLVKIIADFLQQLSNFGVQIFIATHDYLLTHLLSLAAEYPSKKSTPIRFFCFSKESEGYTKIQTGQTLAELDNNPIMEEFAAYHDLEEQLFLSALKK